jgi:hypothetical protein
MEREASSLFRQFRSINHPKSKKREKDTIKEGSVKIFGASGHGEDKKSLGQILQRCY